VLRIREDAKLIPRMEAESAQCKAPAGSPFDSAPFSHFGVLRWVALA